MLLPDREATTAVTATGDGASTIRLRTATSPSGSINDNLQTCALPLPRERKRLRARAPGLVEWTISTSSATIAAAPAREFCKSEAGTWWATRLAPAQTGKAGALLSGQSGAKNSGRRTPCAGAKARFPTSARTAIGPVPHLGHAAYNRAPRDRRPSATGSLTIPLPALPAHA